MKTDLQQSNIEAATKHHQSNLKLGEGVNCHDEAIVLIDSAFPNKPAMTKEQLHVYRMALSDLPVGCVRMAAKAFVKCEVDGFDGRFMPPAPAVAKQARKHKEAEEAKLKLSQRGIDWQNIPSQKYWKEEKPVDRGTEADRIKQVDESFKRIGLAALTANEMN